MVNNSAGGGRGWHDCWSQEENDIALEVKVTAGPLFFARDLIVSSAFLIGFTKGAKVGLSDLSDSTSISSSPSLGPGTAADPGLSNSSWKAIAIEFGGGVDVDGYQVNMVY